MPNLRRLAAMDRTEILWRSGALLRTAAGRFSARVRPPSWNRQAIGRALGDSPALDPVRTAAAHQRWSDAHTLIAGLIAEGPQRFPIGPATRAIVTARVRTEFPGAAVDAARRADRIVSGAYDLLGYRGLRFDTPSGDHPDWHLDPVHGRRAPLRFWSTVPYLDPAIGDHKVIWELNRHQHWLALGRAFWLTNDPRYRTEAIRQLRGWLEANPPLLGVNWSSMLELGFRSISWLWAVHFFAAAVPADEPEAPWLVDAIVALDRQLTHIERNLSYYFSPNTHVLGEALALYVAGQTLPWLRRSSRWSRVGRQVLLAEATRQIEPDGGHAERSAHYHHYTLDFYLLALIVSRLNDDPAADRFGEIVERLASAARLLADDRGRLPHLGDDDGGTTFPMTGRALDDVRDSLAVAAALLGRPELRVGPAPEELFWLLGHERFDTAVERASAPARADAIGSGALSVTGYYVSRSSAGDHLVIDGGPHGYLNAGHAHADALSLTLTVRGTPLVIDPGTAAYTINPEARDRFRSTASHNTLLLDGAPQSVPCGPFHWTRTASGAADRWRANAGFDYFEGTHDGYGSIIHRRHVLVLHGDLVVVADLVHEVADLVHEVADLVHTPGDNSGNTTPSTHRVDIHWHLDPRWQVGLGGRRTVLTAPGEQVQMVAAQGAVDLFCGDAASGLGWHSPVYGCIEPTATLRVTQTGVLPLWTVTVFGLNAVNEVASVEMVPVWAEAGVLEGSMALRIKRAGTTDKFLIAHAAAGRGADATWRMGEIETDAQVIFCRTPASGDVTRVAWVDGSLCRTSGARRLLVSLPQHTTDLHLDLAAQEGQARLSGPAFGARVQVAGRDVTIENERRAAARLKGVR